MGWIRKQILKAVILAIREGDEQTKADALKEIVALVHKNGILIGGFRISDVNGTLTIKRA